MSQDDRTKTKKKRTNFTANQKEVLVQSYNHGMSSLKAKEKIEEVSTKLQLSKKTVELWIKNQNRKKVPVRRRRNILTKGSTAFTEFCTTRPMNPSASGASFQSWAREWRSLEEEEKELFRKKAAIKNHRNVNNISDEERFEQSVQTVRQINELCNHLGNLGGNIICMVDIPVMPGQSFKRNILGSAGGLAFLQQNSSFIKSFEDHFALTVTEPEAKTDHENSNLVKEVIGLYNELYSKVTGKSQRVPYKKIASGEIIVSLEGLPEGLKLRHPSRYGSKHLKQILAAKEGLKFSIENKTEQRQQQQQSSTENKKEQPMDEALQDADPTFILEQLAHGGETLAIVPIRTSSPSRKTSGKRKGNYSGKRKVAVQNEDGDNTIKGDPNDIYEVENILQMKRTKKQKKYKVKWVGFDNPTWEPERMLPKLPRENFGF